METLTWRTLLVAATCQDASVPDRKKKEYLKGNSSQHNSVLLNLIKMLLDNLIRKSEKSSNLKRFLSVFRFHN